MGTLVFTVFSAYFFLAAVPVGAADSCTTLYGSSGSITISSACEFAPGTYNYDDVTVEGGVTVTMGNASSPGQVVLDVSGDFELCATCVLSAAGLGYAVDTGTGAGSSSGGGGYGGNGGLNSSGGGSGDTYGSPTEPSDLGSGGDTGKGGGAIKLVVDGTLTLDGVVNVEGGFGNYNGGGAGGSIWIDAGTVSGSGKLRSVGGGSHWGYSGGSGGGGRAAVYYTNGNPNNWTYEIDGGWATPSANREGGAGTIYFKQSSATYGDLIVDGRDRANTYITDLAGNTSQTYDNITVRKAGHLRVPSGYTLTLADDGAFTGSGTQQPSLAILASGTFDTGSASFYLSGVDIDYYYSGTLGSVQNLILESDTTFTTYDIGTFSLSGDLTVKSGTVLTHGDNSTSKANALVVSAANIDIQSGGSVNVDTRGFDQDLGTGVGSNNGGGGYGGNGGLNSSDAGSGSSYGSVTEPVDLGSGGSSSSADGGGALKLVTSGTLTNSGTIRADGGNGGTAGGGASGGSIWLDAGTIDGSGTVQAIGGYADWGYSGGAGGGGRIAIYYTNGDHNSWTLNPKGGWATQAYGRSGGAGTVYVFDRDSDTYGDLIVGNNNQAYAYYTDMVDDDALGSPKAPTYDNITVKEGARYRVPNGFSLTLANGGTFTSGGTQQPELAVSDGGTYNPNVTNWTPAYLDVDHDGVIVTVTDLTVQDADYIYNTATASFSPGNLNTLTVASGGEFSTEGTSTLTVGTATVQASGTMSHAGNTTTRANVLNLAATTMAIESDGVVEADGDGFNPGQGPGVGSSGGGAGYGGNGGFNSSNAGPGPTYGSVTEPDDIGSGGDGSAAGAGAIKIVVSGTLTNSGTIRADGGNGGTAGGGASGGSVWLDAGTIDGSGTVQAIGGYADWYYSGGAGGGGRIAIYYTGGDHNSWTLNPRGGWGTPQANREGGAGTVYILERGVGTYGDLIVDNDNRANGYYTDMVDDDALGSPKAPTYDNITVKEGAHYRIPNGFSLTLDTGGTFTGSGGSGEQSSITVAEGGAMDLTPAGIIDDCDITNEGTITGTPTLSNQNGDWTNTGTVVNVVDFTCTGGTCI
ncbi:hypothetical protein ACFL26_01315, partial [Patescibacteria group bacterium]